MKRNKTNGCFVVAVTVVFLLCSSLERLYAQDPLPPIARVLEPLNLPGQTKEMHFIRTAYCFSRFFAGKFQTYSR